MKLFNSVRSNAPRRSMFDLSYEKKFDGDFGYLYPVMCDEVVPGDVITLGGEVVIRFQPLVAPILHDINCYVHYFFVPYRLLWDEWEEFITGGLEGPQVPDTAPTIPRWDPTGANAIGSLWDYFGFPTAVVPAGALPLDFPRRAYNFVWQNYYADETQDDIETYDFTDAANQVLLTRKWEKDYFTSALPWQQRGIAPALPITGSSKALWPAPGGGVSVAMVRTTGTQLPYDAGTHDLLENNTVDLSSAATFDVADLRLAFQVQRWMEANARAGVRYTEFLKQHYGVNPRDDRLQRPEFIGGMRSPVIVSEVLQTSSTDATSPQGNLAGHGITADSKFCGKYRAQEFGLIIGLLSVMPKPAYQQGINRQWLRRTRYDYYFPEFANLSEQAIERAELYATDVSGDNTAVWGYQGRYDEMRVKHSMVCGNLRSSLDYWHLARQFSSAPTLGPAFLSCNPASDDLKRVFAVPGEPGMIINYANRIKALRPMPYISEPGLIDHV